MEKITTPAQNAMKIVVGVRVGSCIGRANLHRMHAHYKDIRKKEVISYKNVLYNIIL